MINVRKNRIQKIFFFETKHYQSMSYQPVQQDNIN